MLNIKDLSRINGFRFPKSVIGYAVWAYHRFSLSLRDVGDLLAERGVTVSYETIRDWVNRSGHGFAAKIRRDRPAPADKWHLDEVVSPLAITLTGAGRPPNLDRDLVFQIPLRRRFKWAARGRPILSQRGYPQFLWIVPGAEVLDGGFEPIADNRNHAHTSYEVLG